MTFPYFMSDKDIEFVINAVSIVAVHGWKELPQYTFNPETGEWKHKSQQVICIIVFIVILCFSVTVVF